MTYATQQNMIDRFGETELIQLTDRTGAGVINVTVLNQALADTDAEIDGYLVGRHTLPLASVPEVLVKIACDIARYQLYKDTVTELVQKRYDAAVKYLSLVGQGKLSLDPNAANQITPSTGGPDYVSGTRVFDQSSLADY